MAGRVPLTITVTVGPTVHHYGEEAAGTEPHTIDTATAKTRAALRADILRGVLPRDSITTIQIDRKAAKPFVSEGSLLARSYWQR